MKEFSILKNNLPTGRQEDLKNLFDSFINSFDLLLYLTNLLKSNGLCERTAKKSYSHENGFDKITLFENKIYKLRLHLWNKNNIKYSENIHNHRWDFCSKILTGAYKYENYQIDNNAINEDYYEYEYCPIAGSDKYEMLLKGKQILSLKESGIKSKNDIIELNNNELHKISSIETMTATLFLTGEIKKKTTKVFTKHLIDNSFLPYRYISPIDLKVKIESFLENYQF